MKQTFVCQVCREKLTLTGTQKGIEAAGKLWSKGHQHLLAAPLNETSADTQSDAAYAAYVEEKITGGLE